MKLSNETILKKAIEKTGIKETEYYYLTCLDDADIKHWINNGAYYSIIFSHDFAKAFWGEETEKQEKIKKMIEEGQFISYDRNDYQYHLQQLVIQEEPLKYLEKFL